MQNTPLSRIRAAAETAAETSTDPATSPGGTQCLSIALPPRLKRQPIPPVCDDPDHDSPDQRIRSQHRRQNAEQEQIPQCQQAPPTGHPRSRPAPRPPAFPGFSPPGPPQARQEVTPQRIVIEPKREPPPQIPLGQRRLLPGGDEIAL